MRLILFFVCITFFCSAQEKCEIVVKDWDISQVVTHSVQIGPNTSKRMPLVIQFDMYDYLCSGVFDYDRLIHDMRLSMKHNIKYPHIGFRFSWEWYGKCPKGFSEKIFYRRYSMLLNEREG